MITDQERKAEVLKFADGLRVAGAAKVTVSYYGDGDEGRAEPPQLQDAAENPIDEARLPADLNIPTLGDLLEGFGQQAMRTATAALERLRSTFTHLRFAWSTTGMKLSVTLMSPGTFSYGSSFGTREK